MNSKNATFDVKNYVPLIKHKQLKEWYEIAMKKNQNLKEEVNFIKLQKNQIIQDYEAKLKELNEQNIELLERTKINSQTDITQIFPNTLEEASSAQFSNFIKDSIHPAGTTTALALTKYG